jgi:hypothetical protein
MLLTAQTCQAITFTSQWPQLHQVVKDSTLLEEEIPYSAFRTALASHNNNRSLQFINQITKSNNNRISP